VISFPRRVEKRFVKIASLSTASASVKLTLGDCLS
jgi:hypothetical protein